MTNVATVPAPKPATAWSYGQINTVKLTIEASPNKAGGGWFELDEDAAALEAVGDGIGTTDEVSVGAISATA